MPTKKRPEVKKKKRRYPPWPGSGSDYSVNETARQNLRKPNKVICIYCHHQAKSEEVLTHEPDCPEGRDIERRFKRAKLEAKLEKKTDDWSREGEIPLQGLPPARPRESPILSNAPAPFIRPQLQPQQYPVRQTQAPPASMPPDTLNSRDFRWHSDKSIFTAEYKMLPRFIPRPLPVEGNPLGFIFESCVTNAKIMVQMVNQRKGPNGKVLWCEYESLDKRFLVIIFNFSNIGGPPLPQQR